MARDFLVELGSEELPPKSLRKLSDAFAEGLRRGLVEAELKFDSIQTFATPRRLAVLVSALEEQTPEKSVEVWGPPVAIALDDSGEPTKAGQAFAKKNNIAVDELRFENDGKADRLIHRSTQAGVATSSLLPALVSQSLADLPVAKRMRWGASRIEFVRPVHWLLMLWGEAVLPAEILGLQASHSTFGHRFHSEGAIKIDAPKHYENRLLEDGRVVADFNDRREIVRQQVEALANKAGGFAIIDEDLLDEVTALVEWPEALLGNFDERFLSVPAEALISSMKEHQKYFHMVDANSRLMPHFITVANIVSTDEAKVVDGNERVIRPRLADAAFFFETDKKTPLAERRQKLSSVVFQAQLGSIFAKTERIAELALWLAKELDVDPASAERAGQLCKADLVSDMVFEFTDMQGIAGYHYALNDGEDEAVATAIREHYLPAFAGDRLPESGVSACVALADRLDTLAGIFGIGQKPSGSRDPFALRRASIAVMRILVEKGYDLDLLVLLQKASKAFGDKLKNADSAAEACAYMLERLRAWYEDDGIAPEVFQAVAASGCTNPLEFDLRVKAVAAFNGELESQSLAAAHKRVSNLLQKEGASIDLNVDKKLLAEKSEQNLYQALLSKEEQVAPLYAKRDYTAGLLALAELREVVDAFFENVLVMCEDEAIKKNRLALLQKLRNLFLSVADISHLVPAKA